MRYMVLFLAVLMVMGVGCLNENPVATDTAANSLPELAPDTRMFHARLTTTFTEPVLNFPIVEFTIFYQGKAKRVGKVTGVGPTQVNVLTGAQSGPVTFTDRNGDTIEMDAAGGSSPGPGPDDVVFSGNWVITGGTGQYAGATGSGTYAGTATTGSVNAGQVNFDGVISR